MKFETYEARPVRHGATPEEPTVFSENVLRLPRVSESIVKKVTTREHMKHAGVISSENL